MHHPLTGALPVPFVAVQVTRGVLVAHWYTYAPPGSVSRSTAGLLFPCQYLCGEKLMTVYSIVIII